MAYIRFPTFCHTENDFDFPLSHITQHPVGPFRQSDIEKYSCKSGACQEAVKLYVKVFYSSDCLVISLAHLRYECLVSSSEGADTNHMNISIYSLLSNLSGGLRWWEGGKVRSW